jgi:hypothetical protein
MFSPDERADRAQRSKVGVAADSVDAEQLRAQAQLIRNVNDNTTELI